MSESRPHRPANRFVRPLPSKPDLDKQRKLAKSLARDYWRRVPEAVARVQALHPKPPGAADFSLSDAQLVIARGYGFAGWPQLKRKIDKLTRSPIDLFRAAVERGDVDETRELLGAHPDLVSRINAPLFAFDSPAAHAAQTNLPMLDLLIAHGADLNVRTSWSKGGFGILEQVEPDQAPALIARGATIDACAAAHLGLMDELAALVAEDPARVHAKGGDGKRPLHFARTVEIARFLLEHGAEIDALDDDHDSTPAQHLIGERPDVARVLVAAGARSDILLAAALGDVDLVRRHLAADPRAIAMRVDRDWLPMVDTAMNGGHIYQWTLGFHVSALDVARKRGHAGVVEVLLAHAGPLDQVMDALWEGDETRADAILATDSGLLDRAPAQACRAVADAARNNNTMAVGAMLRHGLSVTARAQHGAMPLHWAAFHGNPEMVAEVLRHDPPLDAHDEQFGGTAIGWLVHGALAPWRGVSTGRHGDCARLLLDAGVPFDETLLPSGHDELDGILRHYWLSAHRP